MVDALDVGAQWLAWRLQMPAIVLMLRDWRAALRRGRGRATAWRGHAYRRPCHAARHRREHAAAGKLKRVMPGASDIHGMRIEWVRVVWTGRHLGKPC
ncbi:MAG TPA: hypothetical protein DCX34_15975 [Roseovarius sp.]|nr:hypothetical protein [Roseovarius sp.]